MKKLSTLFANALMLVSIFTFTASCSNDDDNQPDLPAASSAEGVYSGSMTCTVMGDESIFEDMTVTVEAVDDAVVNVTISSFGNPPMQVPSINVDGVPVVGADDQYALVSTEFSGTTESGRAYSGTMQGELYGEQLTVRFNLQYGAMPMPMICEISAVKN